MPNSLPTFLSPAELDLCLREARSLRLVDVRTPAEFDSVRIPDSQHLPLDRLERGEVDALPETVPIVLVCASGARAGRARTTLEARGFRNIHLLEGGIRAWEAMDAPVVRSGKGVISLERQVRIAAGALVLLGGVAALLLHPLFLLLPIAIGAGLVFAGITDWCGLALLLARLPHNRGSSERTAGATCAPSPRVGG